MSSSISFDIEKAIEIFKELRSWRAVAKKLGVHPYSIQYALEPLGFKSIRPIGQKRTWDIEQAVEMRKKGKSIKELAKIFNRSTVTIRKGLVEYDLKHKEREFR